MCGRKCYWLLLSVLFAAGLWQWSTRTVLSLRTQNRGTTGALQERTVVPSAEVLDAGRQTDPASLRLTNTRSSLESLVRSEQAILLENAWFDTRQGVHPSIPERLRTGEEPGAFIVQAKGPTDAAFRSALEAAKVGIVAYIPNNAWLVTGRKEAVKHLSGASGVQAVIAYEPYYKIKATLLEDAMLPPEKPREIGLNLLLFPDADAETLARLEEVGLSVIHKERSPFGSQLHVRSRVQDLARLASLPGVQAIEPARLRVVANDLSRTRIGIAQTATSAESYLGLTGTNVMVGLNDTGVDADHPDLVGRVFMQNSSGGIDVRGHGTAVAGVIAGSGAHSLMASNVQGSPLPPAANQFRGKAPGANLFAIQTGLSPEAGSDGWLQETIARTNALISNNSWHYEQARDYDFAAASYDAAVRDALPGQTGSQPLVLVFAAGNEGDGANDGSGGTAGSVQSPATAKNVITVGASEQARLITNIVCGNEPTFLQQSDDHNQVAAFSARGNVGIGLEGQHGRFKPDLVAPGTFVVSARSSDWDVNGYYAPSNFTSCPEYAGALSNLNESIGPFYRYESGTSLSAGAVAGTLALVQEFFEQRLGRTNSPALMKALLINGARPACGPLAGLHSSTNYQGWGLVNLSNSLPASLTNTAGMGAAMLLFDQDAAGALKTGETKVRTVSVCEAGRSLPLRVTLVWTDPPGSPVGGIKLVNDLDLVVTNLTNGKVYFGNNFNDAGGFSAEFDPGMTPVRDVVNNVESVLLPPDLGDTYGIGVAGRRVNVRSVAGPVEGVVQDYALVISSGDGEVSDALGLVEESVALAAAPELITLTNFFTASGDEMALALRERVGAQPAVDEPGIPLPEGENRFLFPGQTNQWRFYVVTNSLGFTNAAFMICQASPLAPFLPRPDKTNFALRTAPDIDLYVSSDPNLLLLEPSAVSGARKSLSRGAMETVVSSDAVAGPYYVAVKCESRGGAEFQFAAVFSDNPFAGSEGFGTEILRGFPLPGIVSEVSGASSNVSSLFAVSPSLAMVRRAVVTNMISSERLGDLSAGIVHGGDVSVLRQFSTNGPATNLVSVYDDSLELDFPWAQPAAGPGSLSVFSGKEAFGTWLLATTTTNGPATNDNYSVRLEHQQEFLPGTTRIVYPGGCRDEFFYVPWQATNLAFKINLVSNAGPVTVRFCPETTTENNCYAVRLDGVVTNVVAVLDAGSNPPLVSGGVYRISMCNSGTGAVELELGVSTAVASEGSTPVLAVSKQVVPITDEAHTSVDLLVTNSGVVSGLEVGVRLAHPRVSDLALALTSPQGTRVLLSENRGAGDTNGMGREVVLTNIVPVSSSGGPKAMTNTLDVGHTAGVIEISYDFYGLPDFMRVYYEGGLLFDSGMVSGIGGTNLSFGPGSSTTVTIVMNEGDNYDPDTAWFYTVSSTREEPLYFTFTENTNFATVPIKFARPPFDQNATGGGLFYLAEETLAKLKGETAAGRWKLDIWDAVAGGNAPAASVVSWRLSFAFADVPPVPVPLTHGVVWADRLSAGRIQWFRVNTPEWAQFATNALLSSSVPVSVLYNASQPPAGTNVGDILLLTNVLSGASALGTNGTPNFIPGAEYYLGIWNTNQADAWVEFRVSFDVAALQPGVAVSASGGPGPRYFLCDIGPDATAASFQVYDVSGEADLVLQKGLPFPTLENHLVGSFNPGNHPETIILFNESAPVGLSPGQWYLGILNASPGDTYTVRVDVFTNTWPEIVDLLDGVSVSANNDGLEPMADYYRFEVSTNAARVQFDVTGSSGEVALVARRGLPLPDSGSFDFVSANPGTNDEWILITTNSSPMRLSPGTWFLGVLNISGEDLGYSIRATESADNLNGSLITASAIVDNSFCLTWMSLPGAHYFVQGRESLSGSDWVTLSKTITAENLETTWCLELPSTYRFFRIREGVALEPFSGASVLRMPTTDAAGVSLKWNAPTNQSFEVQWSTGLSVWDAFTNVVTSPTGLFQFLDDGSQSGGVGQIRFYRTRQLP